MHKQEYSNWYPGQVWPVQEELYELTERKVITIIVKNTGDRPVQIGSHFHFFEVNKFLEFDRRLAYGKRLAISAGTAVRFEPGMSQEVGLVALGGERICYGLNNLVNGKLDDPEVKRHALQRAKELGFKGA